MTAKSTNNNDTDAAARVAVFPGSFNPFTIGHASVVQRALSFFDHIVIAVGVNVAKPGSDVLARENADAITRLYNKSPRVSVVIWDGLMVDLARSKGACAFVRGVRNSTDFEYERTMADVNRRISGIDTILLPTLPQYADISSSTVRELQSFGLDVSEMLPHSK